MHGNCLDFILMHEDSSIIKYTIPSDLITDHFEIICIIVILICMLKIFKVNTDSSIVYYRNIKSINLNIFSLVISEYIIIDNRDISYFNDALSKVLDTFAHLKKNKKFPSPIFSLV